LAAVLPHRGRVRLGLRLATLARPLKGLLQKTQALRPLAAMLALAPGKLPKAAAVRPPAIAAPVGRVAMLGGCVEPVLRPQFQAAATRLLGRMGFEMVPAPGEACCGALVHHMGREAAAQEAARRNVDAWTRLIEAGGLDAILVTASGCGTMIKDYGFLLREDPAYAGKAAQVSALARDISEFLAERELPPGDGRGLTVAYHPPCSLLHGQKVVDAPRRLLAEAGYQVRLPADAHLCCGSAGTYNILQPEIASRLKARKLDRLAKLAPDVVATGNIGCLTQLANGSPAPVVHLVELLDWATGGPVPAELALTLV
jgi:glycolate oxidase iron-sulfur subunit